MFVRAVAGHRPDLLAHSPVGDHSPGQARGLNKVVLGAGRVFAKDELLGSAPSEHEDEPVFEIGLADVHPILLRHQLRDAEGPAAGDDRHLVEVVDARQEP